MSFVTVNNYYAADTYDAIDKLKDTLVSAGWTLHDDRSAESSHYYILTSNGEDGDEPTCYLYIGFYDENINFRLYSYWDNSTHAGSGGVCYSNAYGGVEGHDDAPFYIWISATKNEVALVTSVSYYYAIHLFLHDNFVDFENAVTTAAASAGSDVVLTLSTGDASKFEVGQTYYAFEHGAYRQRITVSSIDTGSEQITVDSLPYALGIGTYIGRPPYRWAFIPYYRSYTYMINWSADSNSNSAYQKFDWPFYARYLAPNHFIGKYIAFPVIPEVTTSYHGIPGFQKVNEHTVSLGCYTGGASQSVVSIGEKDDGTSSGSNTTTTLNDTTKAWSINEFQNKIVAISGGTGQGQFRLISSNTADQLTISEAWVTTPDDTSTYVIADEGWLYFSIRAYGDYPKRIIRMI